MDYYPTSQRNTATVGGVLMDTDRNIGTVLSLDGDHSKTRRFQILNGMTGSALEHAVFEAVLSEPTLPVEAVSAVKALQVASSQGIPIHSINSGNLQTKLAILQVDNAIKTDIQAAVNAGMVVTVSERAVQINSWTGVGYILLDPTTGAGVYRISGGLSGGSLTQKIALLKDFIKNGATTPDRAKEILRNYRGQTWFRGPTNAGVESVTSGWGIRKDPFKGVILERHDGVDIAVGVGTPVYAVADGVAVHKENPSGFGTYLEINHGLDVYTLYGHLSAVIKTGQVNEGDIIGLSGNSGRSTRPHLHFAIFLTTGINSGPYPLFKGNLYNFDASVDPRSFIWVLP